MTSAETTPKTDPSTIADAQRAPSLAPPVGEDTAYRREDWHWLQRLMDNPWILLVLGILIPMLSYTAWGWIELLLIKPAQLP